MLFNLKTIKEVAEEFEKHFKKETDLFVNKTYSKGEQVDMELIECSFNHIIEMIGKEKDIIQLLVPDFDEFIKQQYELLVMLKKEIERWNSGKNIIDKYPLVILIKCYNKTEWGKKVYRLLNI